MYLRKKGRSKKSVVFNPDSEYCEKAVNNYLKSGGRITRIKTPSGYERFMALTGNLCPADKHLMGD